MKNYTKLCLLILLMTLTSFSKAEINTDEKWMKICEQYKSISIPTADIKQDSLPSTNCNSMALYYGIDMPVDYKAALQCAYAEKIAKSGFVFGGDNIIMMIYATGFGVKQNYDLAINLACSSDGAPMEMSGRITHLLEIKNSKTQYKVFDFCDDITSGFMMGHCAAKNEKISAVKRTNEINSISSNWTAAERASFQKLQTASEFFTEKRSRGEVDLSGTARSMFLIQEEAILKKDFLQSIQLLEKNKAPKYSSKQLQEENKKLEEIYAKTQSKPSGQIYGTVKKEDVQATQEAWMAYRDAWINFAKIRYPKYSSASIATWFTKKRNHMLNSFHLN